MDPDPAIESAETRPSYLRRNAFSIVVVLAFSVLGWYLGPLVAPEIVRWRSGLAAAMLGAFSGGAAVLNRLLD